MSRPDLRNGLFAAPKNVSAPLARALQTLLADPLTRDLMEGYRLVPARASQERPVPASLSPELKEALGRIGIENLFSHQARAIEEALLGHDVLQVTPTASGKSLGFLLPVLDAVIRDPASRALFIFPTKALAQDQLAQSRLLAREAGMSALIETYDGDTPPGLRRAAELGGHVILTNPDMLHSALLPHHTKWIKFLAGLKYVVIDELHTYRGIFGSHMANVLRRLMRLSAHYGSHPTLLMASATVGNPEELARRLTGRDATIIDESGAPSGERLVAILNPPPLIPQTGIRPSPLTLAVDLTERTLAEKTPTILFVPSRTQVEVAYRRLSARLPKGIVASYRGGYLPSERRKIEAGLRSGEILGVVTTNALELGVDIGQLDVSILAGFPPTVASSWQQIGRAGRRQTASAAFIVAGPSPRDQFLSRHPELFFGASPESALLNPDNLHVLVDHLKISAFELPFKEGETFGDGNQDLESLLDFLSSGDILRKAGSRYFYAGASFPAHEISLRMASHANVVIFDTTKGGKPIGEVDRPSAPTLVHDQAIYIHRGETYEVEHLDLVNNKAYVRPTVASYYTDANLAVGLAVLEEDERTPLPGVDVAFGDLKVTWLATIFKKIHLETGENLGWGKIQLPEDEMHTQGMWLALDPDLLESIPAPQRPDALAGLGRTLHGLLPLLTMTSPLDIGLSTEVRSPFTLKPTIYLYDRVPGGIGLAKQGFKQAPELLAMARDLIRSCSCEDGCPSCVGEEGRRKDVESLLERLP